MSLRIGVDTGGTFTDVCLYDDATGGLEVFKTPSTPHDPGTAVLTGIETAVERAGKVHGDVQYLAHGTTVATNALLEEKGGNIALFVTEGFRDLLELGRQRRPKLYDLYEQKPRVLVPRDQIIEISERVRYDGHTIKALDEDVVRGQLRDNSELLSGMDAIAVCFLYSFENPAHEETLRRLIAEEFPGAFVTLSSEVLPQFREFERLSTTTVNAYIGPLMRNYLRSLRERLAERGLGTAPKVTQSNGGVISFPTAEQLPVRTVLSGPSTGVVGAAVLGARSGHPDIITLDVGGTSSDLALVNGGIPSSSNGMELDGRPIQAPMLDISTVGAGGGSVAWIDNGGLLKVGPQSAGAYPGPACYGNGSTEPTVTDANVVLGILNNETLLGGTMPIDASLAFVAVKSLGDRLGLGVEETAQGILSVVTANMAKAIRVISVQKGYDPSEYALVAFGGAGPLHSGRLARELNMNTTLIPRSPGAMSAVGMLMTDLKADFISTARTLLDDDASLQIHSVFDGLGEQADTWVESEGIEKSDAVFTHHVDLRYKGQNYEITVPIEQLADHDELTAQLVRDFEERHRSLYGYINDGSAIELVNFRLQAVGPVDKISISADGNRAAGEPTTTRDVYLAEFGERRTVPIYERFQLAVGQVVEGPAVIEQYDTTLFVLPMQSAVVDEFDMLITREHRPTVKE